MAWNMDELHTIAFGGTIAVWGCRQWNNGKSAVADDFRGVDNETMGKRHYRTVDKGTIGNLQWQMILGVKSFWATL